MSRHPAGSHPNTPGSQRLGHGTPGSQHLGHGTPGSQHLGHNTPGSQHGSQQARSHHGPGSHHGSQVPGTSFAFECLFIYGSFQHGSLHGSQHGSTHGLPTGIHGSTHGLTPAGFTPPGASYPPSHHTPSAGISVHCPLSFLYSIFVRLPPRAWPAHAWKESGLGGPKTPPKPPRS